MREITSNSENPTVLNGNSSVAKSKHAAERKR